MFSSMVRRGVAARHRRRGQRQRAAAAVWLLVRVVVMASAVVVVCAGGAGIRNMLGPGVSEERHHVRSCVRTDPAMEEVLTALRGTICR